MGNLSPLRIFEFVSHKNTAYTRCLNFSQKKIYLKNQSRLKSYDLYIDWMVSIGRDIYKSFFPS